MTTPTHDTHEVALPRLDLVHRPVDDLSVWRAAAVDAHARGFGALLCPEVPGAVDPVAALAAAAEAEPRLRVGTFVLAASLRTPAELTEMLQRLADAAPGRVDVGLGIGRPETRAGGTLSSSTLRARLEAVCDGLGRSHPDLRLSLAAGGRRALGLAGRLADEVILALSPDAGVAAVPSAREVVVGAAGDRADGRVPGLVVSLVAVGDVVAGFHARRCSAATLREQGAFSMLPAGAAAARGTLEVWGALGVTRVVADSSLLAALQPVLDDLATVSA